VTEVYTLSLIPF